MSDDFPWRENREEEVKAWLVRLGVDDTECDCGHAFAAHSGPDMADPTVGEGWLLCQLCPCRYGVEFAVQWTRAVSA